MANLLIAIAVDLAGGPGPAWEIDRIARTMLLGKAGDVRKGEAGGAVLFARAQTPLGTPRIRPLNLSPAADGGLTLFAGRLFERPELRKKLPDLPQGADDAALYAAAHMQFGDDCDRHVIGNYAAIRWFPGQGRVRIARSPTSDCPIHIWRSGSRLVAGSVPRVLFAAGASDRLSDATLADLLLLAGPQPAASIYDACSRVPAASVFDADRDRERLREFWSIREVPPVRFKRDEDYVEAVAEQFERSVRAHLAEIQRPAVSLSGGLDSQAVAAFAVEALPSDSVLRTYTSVPMEGWTPPKRPWKFGDEGDHARALAAMHGRIVPSFITAADVAFGETLEQRSLLSSWPPFNETNAHWGSGCYAQAAADGCDAVLRGDLGNAGFSYDGLTGYPTWLAKGRWLRLLRELRASQDPRPLWRRFASLAVWPHVPNRVRLWRDRANPYRSSPFQLWCPLREDYAVASGALDRARANASDIDEYESPDSRSWRDEVVRSQLSGSPEIYMGFQLAHGVALPDPTGFVPLLELCAGIPDEQYLRGGTDRWLARRMLTGRAPEMVVNETRKGIQGADWPQRFGRERPALMAELKAMKADPRMAALFDFDRMVRDLDEWDGTDNLAAGSFARINSAIGRGLSTARFVRFVEGRNVG